MTDRTALREKAEKLLKETIRQAHDVGWGNAAGASRIADLTQSSFDSSREAAEVLQYEAEQLLALVDQEGELFKADPDMEPFREDFPAIYEAWHKLWAYVRYRAYGPDDIEESRGQEWTTTALRLNKLGQRIQGALRSHRRTVTALPGALPEPTEPSE